VSVPGTLELTATAGTTTGDVTGLVVLTRGSDTRRIPFWFLTTAPRLADEPKRLLARPGAYRGTTAGAPSLVSQYRYPTAGGTFRGPERAYRFRVPAGAANAGVVVLSGKATPLVTFDGSEDRLAGYAGLPLDLNPYRKSVDEPVHVAGVVLPSAGFYDAVFEATGTPGPFTFRFWVNDVRPPTLRLRSTHDTIVVSATDAGSGVDPSSIVTTIDGKPVRSSAVHYGDGVIRIRAPTGVHRLVLAVSDYQEAKNMEDVVKILPNTATLRTTVRVG
jgi:hypothetical protein